MRYTRAEIVDGTGFDPDARFEQVTDYNGWANRETWAMALWINNDQGWQESVTDALRTYLTDRLQKETDEPHIYAASETFRAYEAGKIIRENVEEMFDWDNYGNEHGGQRCVPALLLVALEDIGSLYRVDWDELGANFLTDLDES